MFHSATLIYIKHDSRMPCSLLEHIEIADELHGNVFGVTGNKHMNVYKAKIHNTRQRGRKEGTHT